MFDFLSYLDFNTGSVIVQAVVGAMAGATLFGHKIIAQIRHRLGIHGKKDSDDDIIPESVKQTSKD